jgi:hypothetical protein
MVMAASFRDEMRKAKLKNLTDLSYESKIPFSDLKRLVSRDLDDNGFNLLDKLKGFFKCKISRIFVKNPTVWRFNGNAYEPISGVVYFIRNVETGLTKIGFTTDLINRIYNLSLEHKAEMKLIHYISTYDSATLESVMHDIFLDKKVMGEWFNLTDEDIYRIKGK